MPSFDASSVPPKRPSGHLPRLSPAAYRGHAAVFWTLTMEDRRTGWLDDRLHAAFRELLLHAAARQGLWCPVYVLMPDHLHLIWIGMTEMSDQRKAMIFLRRHLAPRLAPACFQHQPHDHVLRPEERQRGAFTSTVNYLCENPVRAGLTQDPATWPWLGCVIPGYPDLHPLRTDYWDLFWRLHNSAAAPSRVTAAATSSPA